MSQTTEALVLKTSAYSESTLIVWLLTREEGVARALAKGARRLKGGSSPASFDVFGLVRVSMRLVSPERLGNISSVELVRSWDYLRDDVKRFAFASLGLEILGAAATSSAPEPFFYDEAVRFLDALGGAAAPGSLTTALLIRALHHSGHPPRLDPRFGGKLPPGRLAYDFTEGIFTLDSGAAPEDEAEPVVEASHVGGRPGADDDRGAPDKDDFSQSRPSGHYPVPRTMVESLAPALTAPPPLADAFMLRGRDGRRALRWAVRVWEDLLHQPIRSLAFLEKSGWL